jgi:hypothetical protein
MKKATLLLLCGALVFCACHKDPVPEPPSKDAELTGEKVDVSVFPQTIGKIFLLNEGGMGSNNASLDFLRISDGNYITGAFKKMNPGVGAGLGDVGNDIAIHGDEVWIIVNNSGIVEVISAKDETEIAAIAVPTPRNIAFDDRYAYVTSWAGAFANGIYDENGSYTITDSSNPKGQVYRIDLNTKKVAGTVEVGYQPEGIAYYNGKLYVANSGGISSQLPPNYAYDKTVSIIDADSFRVTRTVEVQVNLKNVYSDGKGFIYVTTLGNYWDVHSGLYVFSAADPRAPYLVGSGEDSILNPDYLHVSCSCIQGDTVYCIGTPDEFDWTASHTYNVWCVKQSEDGPEQLTIGHYGMSLTGTPYGMAAVGFANSEFPSLLVGDAGDYFNPGTVSCYRIGNSNKLWTVTAGVCPGHFAVY